jgi:hypothetical protein
MTEASNPWSERHPTVEALYAEVYPNVQTVQNELDEIHAEMEIGDYWATLHRNHTPGTVLTDWDTVTRRRFVQEFTRKQMQVGERILNGSKDC